MRRMLLQALTAAISVVPSCATTVVLVRTPEHIVVAADSLWLGTTDWHRYFPYIGCKINRVGNVYFTVSTVDTDAMQVQALARRAINHSASVIGAAKNFRGMVDEIAKRTAAHELQSQIERCRRMICTEVAFFGVEHGAPVFAAVKLEQIGGARESLKLVPHEYLCPGKCDQRRKTVWIIGRRDHLIRKRKVDPHFFTRYLDEATARRLVEVEAAADPQYVGGPIDVLMLNSTGAHWMPVKGGTCSPDEIVAPQRNSVPDFLMR